MLQPKRTKYRKQHKGRINGLATSGASLAFGAFGLKALAPERLTAAGFTFAHTDLAEALRTSAQGGSTGSSGTGSASVGSVGARR